MCGYPFPMDSSIRLLGEIFLLPASEVGAHTKENYELLAIRKPVKKIIPEFTNRERLCLKLYTIDCLSIKEIAHKIGVTDRAVRFIFDALRAKILCKNNNEIIAKVYANSWHKIL